ncbi:MULTISPECIES: DUF4136 domain-containing protein [unclassified Limnohabitans]|uniref:DUF4136 domain-containing protein n=1 Tax=unclassified Limnohabitans TaxID=2626134 RepID=UPI000AAC98BA|nr:MULTISPECIES: DUF4136 domain-containing protein [unclassified Limnohabitans]PUE20993.1 hypothetical protein B9Z48_00610 [Limnohabitans sp. WS1]
MLKDTPQIIRLVQVFLATLALTLLSGCASMRLVDSDVVSVAAVPPGMSLQGAKYRFERLPSQANNPEAGLAEQQAQAAMTAVGLVRDDAGASLSVMVGFNGTQYPADPWGRPITGPGWIPQGSISIGSGFGSHIGLGMGMRFPPPTHYRREVSLIMRDLKSGQVVYETRASHAGPWSDSVPIFATLFQAALANFPNPPAGPRRVNIELPR